MREVPQVSVRRTEDDNAHSAASMALDEVLAWFKDDGYTATDLKDLASGSIDTLYEDDRA